MRRFHSYGPVDCEEHFCVPRTALVEQCVQHLVGGTEKSGHYFTIWAPRQTGKTWLMRQARDEIERRFPNQFTVGTMSMQGIIFRDNETGADPFLDRVGRLFKRFFGLEIPNPSSWEQFAALFSRDSQLFDKPVVLFVDEFDSLPREVIDRLVTLFRDIYLNRDEYVLHGLALIGVRAVLGVESLRGSPFNIQRSLHVPNFTAEETAELFRQYETESGQAVEPEVVAAVHDATRGQPGLVGWFGELLAEKYNPGVANPIGMTQWEDAYYGAMNREWNNTVLNLIKKAEGPFAGHVLKLFSNPEIPFSIRAEWCAYLYLNGIIDEEKTTTETGRRVSVCRFSSPFVQDCLFHAFTSDLVGDDLPFLPVEPLDDLSDVFSGSVLDIPALLDRYKGYLVRLKAAGIDPWKDQPRRSDLRLTEAVGHFHLFAWLQNAVGRRCAINPEFPTGNGRVDLHLRCNEKRGLIEVKSFRERSELNEAKVQAAGYAKRLGFPAVTIALFIAVADETVLAALSGEDEIDGVQVRTVAIGWV